MPIHDWTRVKAGIFQDFHHSWVEEIKRALNAGILPDDYYALAEQHAVGLGPDVLTLRVIQSADERGESGNSAPTHPSGGVALAVPKIQLTAETEMEYYRRKKSSVAIRHVSGDRVVAFVEVVSPGNKNSRHGFRAFVEKAAELLDRRIHLLILDLFPPGKRDPQGIHAAIWEEITAEEFTQPLDKPLTLVAYETALTVKAYVEPRAVGDTLTEMPLFLEPGYLVNVPLEQTYQNAFAAVPRRWRSVLERP